MSLIQLDNSKTDKNTTHSYLPLYQLLLSKKQLSSHNILDIGMNNIESIKLWKEFFTNATIYGIDMMDNTYEPSSNIIFYTSIDPYNKNFFTSNFLNKNIKFDIIVNDGPHTLDSMIKCIQLYSTILADNGILIIEDIQYWEWIKVLIDSVPKHLSQFVKFYDLRNNKNRYDDIIFTIDCQT